MDALKNSEYPIYDVFATKRNALRLAADVAVTILRVDQIIMAKVVQSSEDLRVTMSLFNCKY